MPYLFPEPCCVPVAPVHRGKECTMVGSYVLSWDLGKNGQRRKTLCREAESLYYLQNSVHPFLLLISSSGLGS